MLDDREHGRPGTAEIPSSLDPEAPILTAACPARSSSVASSQPFGVVDIALGIPPDGRIDLGEGRTFQITDTSPEQIENDAVLGSGAGSRLLGHRNFLQ